MKRLIVTTAILFAICLCGPLDPSLADVGNESPANDFLIEVKVKSQYDWLYSSGRFQASGAISDRGTACTCSIAGVDLDLNGKHGRLKLDYVGDEVFVIFDATGDYEQLIGVFVVRVTGESKVRRNGDIISYYVLMGTLTP